MHSRRRSAVLLVIMAILLLVAGRTLAQTEPAGGPPAAGEGQAVAQPAEEAGEAAAAAPEGEGPAAAEREDEELTRGEAFLLKLRQGGLTMVFLFLASVAMVGYAIERFVNLRSGKLVPEGLAAHADELWRNGDWEQLKALDEKKNSTLARVIATVARHRQESMADVSVLAGDVATRDLRRERQKAYPLAVVATVSPLLGLLGTVIGMIGAFDKVAAAGTLGDASLLGGDISKALITTATGLSIAVPALVLYHYFKSRTNYYAILLEEEVGDLIADWFGAESGAQKRAAKEAKDAG